MTFEQVLQFIRDQKIQRILADEDATDFQKAADIHALLDEQPAKTERKPRAVKPKPPTDHGNDGLI
jgi:hypothetical protein